MADTLAAPAAPRRDRNLSIARSLSAAVAAVVVLDMAVVKAPGLGLLAIPFLAGAFAFRRGRMAGSIALLVAALGYVAIGVNYLVGTGLHAENWADLVFGLAGTPAAAALAAVLVQRLVRRRTGDH